MTRHVLYVVSRFPKITETFVVNEWCALTSRFDMYLTPLVRTDEEPIHDATVAVQDRAWIETPYAPASFIDHTRVLRRSPVRYRTTLRELARATSGAPPAERLKSFAAFHRGVRIATLAQRHGIEHVHAHFANHATTAAWTVHRLTGIPFSFTAHANDLFRDPLMLDAKGRDASFVVAISEYNRRLLERYTSRDRLHVVHCGVDTTRFAPMSRAGTPAGTGRPRVLCVASFEPKKGHRDLIAAFAQVTDEHPNIELRLVGDGPQRSEIRRLAAECNVASRVVFLGARSANDVRAELAAADLFVLAARQDESGRMDGIPVALMEAMASGVPVVTTAVSGIPELVDDGVGVVTPPGDVHALVKGMKHVLGNTTVAARLADRGRQRVIDEFDLHRQATKLGDLIDTSITHSTARTRD